MAQSLRGLEKSVMNLVLLGALVALVVLQGSALPPNEAATIIGISTARLHAISIKDGRTLAHYTTRTPPVRQRQRVDYKVD